MSPWRLLRQDLNAVLASLRLKSQELWRLNASGQLARPGFWPRSLAAGFWPLLLLTLLAMAIAAGFGLAAIAKRPEPATPGPQVERVISRPGTSLSTTSAEPQPLWVLDPEALAEAPALTPSPSGAADLLETRPAEPAGLDTMVPLGAPLGAPTGEGLAGPLGAGKPAEPLPAGGSDQPETAGLGAEEATSLLELFRAATPQAPPQAVEFTQGPLTVVLRSSAGFARASSTARQDWADRWLELARERGFNQLTLLDPAGRLLGKQARVGSGMILLQPFRESS